MAPMACMHDEIVRNIRTIVRFMAAAYLKRHQVSAIDCITDSFQLSTDHLAAGAEPAPGAAALRVTALHGAAAAMIRIRLQIGARIRTVGEAARLAVTEAVGVFGGARHAHATRQRRHAGRGTAAQAGGPGRCRPRRPRRGRR